jgi:hypothetical protein
MPNSCATPFEGLFPSRPRPSRRVLWWLIAVILLLLLCAATVWHLTARHVISSSGGIYFLRPVTLTVPPFRQADPAWHNDQLGNSTDTIGRTGCAITAAAMVFKSYGIDTDPHRLNAYLTGHNGYVGNGYVVWERIADLSHGAIRKAYEDAPSYWQIDRQLLKGNPVIVRLHLPGGTTHFVVIAGKRGFDYLIVDPGAGWSRGLYPLRDITPRIEALRYYRRSKSSPQLAVSAPLSTPAPRGE